MTPGETSKVGAEILIEGAGNRFTNASYAPYNCLTTASRQILDFRKEKTPKSGRFSDSRNQYTTDTYKELTSAGFVKVRVEREAFVNDETLRSFVYVGFFEDFLPFGRLSRSFSEGEIEDLIERYLEVVERIRFWKWSRESGDFGGMWMKVLSSLEEGDTEVRESESWGAFEIGEESWKSRDQRPEGGLERSLGESYGVDVAWVWKSLEGALGEEIRDPWERVSSSSAECESESRDSYQVGESSSVRRALGKLVSASGQLVLCGRRPKRLIGNNVRHIKTCRRPRSYWLGGLEGFAGSSLRPEVVVGPFGSSYETETTGCPRTRSMTTYLGARAEICSRKNPERRVPEKNIESDNERRLPWEAGARVLVAVEDLEDPEGRARPGRRPWRLAASHSVEQPLWRTRVEEVATRRRRERMKRKRRIRSPEVVMRVIRASA